MSPSICSWQRVMAAIWASERKVECSWRFVISPTYLKWVKKESIGRRRTIFCPLLMLEIPVGHFGSLPLHNVSQVSTCKNSFPFSHSFYSITDQGLICHSPPIYVVLHLQKIIKIIPISASLVKNLYPTTVKVNAKTNRRPPKECIVLR